MTLNVSEKQLIISIKNLLSRNKDTSSENLDDFSSMFFCSYKKDLGPAYSSLLKKGIIQCDNGRFLVCSSFEELASLLVNKNPRFRFWYNDWYRLAEKSEAHSILCERSYGIDLCQTGMMTLNQINYIANTIIGRDKNILDLGCGSGHISEYIAEICSSKVTGIDIIVNGIKAARKRTYVKNDYIHFYLRNMVNYDSEGEKFDYILSFDTIYFLGNKFHQVITNSLNMLNHGGKLLILYSAWNPKDNSLSSSSTALGEYLNKTGIKYTYVDFTEDDRIHWYKKHEVLLQLKELFIKEGNKIVYDNRILEAEFFSEISKENKLFRYLYVICKN